VDFTVQAASILITQELSLLNSAGRGRAIWFSCVGFCIALAGHRMGYGPKAQITKGLQSAGLGRLLQLVCSFLLIM